MQNLKGFPHRTLWRNFIGYDFYYLLNCAGGRGKSTAFDLVSEWAKKYCGILWLLTAVLDIKEHCRQCHQWSILYSAARKDYPLIPCSELEGDKSRTSYSLRRGLSLLSLMKYHLLHTSSKDTEGPCLATGRNTIKVLWHESSHLVG